MDTNRLKELAGMPLNEEAYGVTKAKEQLHKALDSTLMALTDQYGGRPSDKEEAKEQLTSFLKKYIENELN